nr:retrovirus-related Pol polyprotein from transposon TNT 1-94 [Tanacetum cinerariifolium]
MIEVVMHTVKNDMVIHTEKTGMPILVVEIKYVGMITDVVDNVTWSFDGLQPEQVDLKYVHALIEPHLHDIRVIPNRHEVDQHLSCADPLLTLHPSQIYSTQEEECYSSKNYVRKFLRALHSKWRVKVTAIEESKDLTSLSLDELIRDLKVHEMIIKKYSEIVKAKVERKSLALKAKKESSDEECRLSVVKTKKCPKPPKDKNQKAFVGGSWSDSGEKDDEKVKNEMCLVAQASIEVCLGVDLEPDEWIKNSGCSKHMTDNRKLFSSYKAYNGGNVIFGSNLRGNIIGKGNGYD